MAHEKDFFINLRNFHVFEQFRERAKAPTWDNFKIEHEIRHVLRETMERDDFLENRNSGEKLCRIALDGLEVVYAVLEPGHPEGKYKWMINTVYSQEMYHKWSREGRIGTLGERISEEEERDLRTAIKECKPIKVVMGSEHKDEEVMFLIECREGKSTRSIKLPESQIGEYILSLLKQGKALSDIKVYKPISDFKLTIEI